MTRQVTCIMVNDFIGRFSSVTKPCPQKSAKFINRLTAP